MRSIEIDNPIRVGIAGVLAQSPMARTLHDPELLGFTSRRIDLLGQCERSHLVEFAVNDQYRARRDLSNYLYRPDAPRSNGWPIRALSIVEVGDHQIDGSPRQPLQ